MSPATTIKLNDGRELAFLVLGNQNGNPVLYFHGFPGSLLEIQKFNQIAIVKNYRQIAIDRPGMGLSTIDKKRSLLFTANAVASLADNLGITKFSVMAHSGVIQLPFG